MNKQQLAQKIWASANQMRSKIEANEYKDYILGFIFYKYLSDKEIKFLKEMTKRLSGFKRISATLLPIKTSFLLGSRWVRTLMFQMSVMHSLRSAG